MNKKRFEEIDILRGFSILIIILIHSCVNFLNNKLAFIIWDYSQFAVVVFIFCSAFIFFVREPQVNLANFIKYFEKRLWRLLPTYYFFAALYLILSFLFQKKIITSNTVIANLLLFGGLDFNWLVLLFVYLTAIMPVVYFLYNKNRFLFYFSGLLTLVSAVVFIFYRPLNYRIIMWLPWSLILYFTLIILKNKDNKKFLLSLALTFLVIFLSLKFTIIKGTQFQNKYPPNLYHLSYGIFSLILLYFISGFKLFNTGLIKKFLYFLSLNSYTIFFIHIIIIFLITVPLKLKLNWYSFFFAVLTLTILVQNIINFFIKIFNSKSSQ